MPTPIRSTRPWSPAESSWCSFPVRPDPRRGAPGRHADGAGDPAPHRAALASQSEARNPVHTTETQRDRLRTADRDRPCGRTRPRRRLPVPEQCVSAYAVDDGLRERPVRRLRPSARRFAALRRNGSTVRCGAGRATPVRAANAADAVARWLYPRRPRPTFHLAPRHRRPRGSSFDPNLRPRHRVRRRAAPELPGVAQLVSGVATIEPVCPGLLT